MTNKKRIRYLQKKKGKKKKKDASPRFFTKFDEDGFHISEYLYQRKMSEMLITLVEPFQQNCPSKDFLYTIGIVAWNISIKPSLRNGMPIPDGLDDYDSEMFNQIIDLLIARKKKLFPMETRIMVDYFLEENNGDHTLIVTSLKAI